MTNEPSATEPLGTRPTLPHGLRRSRRVVAILVLLPAVGWLTSFAADRMASARGRAAAAIEVVVADIGHLAAEWERSAVAYSALNDDDALDRGRLAKLAAESRLADLGLLTADSDESAPLVDSLRATLGELEQVLVDPAFTNRRLSHREMIAGEAILGRLSLHAESLRANAIAQYSASVFWEDVIQWSALALIILVLAVFVVMFRAISRQLVTEFERDSKLRRHLKAQSSELSLQAQDLASKERQMDSQALELRRGIADRDETNRLLEETAAFLDSAVESAPLGVAFLSLDLRLLRVNAALAEQNGATPSAHIGRTITEMMPGSGPAIAPILARVLRTGMAETDVPIEDDAATKMGDPRKWRITCYPLRARGRPPVGVGAMILDVTERSLLEDQLRQAQKMEAVGRLAGGIAHDFNNVLTIIQSYGELLTADMSEGDPGREELDAIRAAADRAAALARQLLAFSRRDVVIPRVLDVNESVSGMESILRRLLQQGIQLEIALADEPLLVRIDGGQLEQVLLNLAINAIDAMPQGGVLRIETSARSGVPFAGGPQDQPATVIRVIDTGTGMSEEVMQRLFEPFFTTKPASRGTGLGLATAYAIARAADGVIRAESTLGSGSVFELILPRMGESEREPEMRPSPARGAPIRGAHETILLVEDEPAIRLALARMLRGHDYRVIEASNGGEAMRLAEAEPGVIDLLLTDVMMPGIGGKELVQRLLVTRPNTRVILMSGYTDDELLRSDLGNARYVFLQKPFSARRAVAAVRDLLDAD